MKSAVLFLILLPVIYFSSCKKDNNNTDAFTVNGVTNLKSSVGQTNVLNLSISKTNQKQENVTLSLKDVPAGVSYAFETASGKPDFVTTLSIIVTSEATLGVYPITLEANSESTSTKISFYLNISDELSLTMTIFDATQRSENYTSGRFAPNAVVNIYQDKIAFSSGIPNYTALTDSDGNAKFYHLPTGTYYYTVQKDALSNISQKKNINGVMLGFAIVSIFRTNTEIQNSSQPTATIGDLRYRDQDLDGSITEADRIGWDILTIYDKTVTEKVTWIGN